MANIALTIAYAGTAYLGWQKTVMGPSIEETLEGCLNKLLQEEVALQAASRTDAGVHARCQCVNFISEKWDSRWTEEKLLKSLNSLLPSDIAVFKVEKMEEAFHPTLDCKKKEYLYKMSNREVLDPHERDYCWHYPYRLDLKLMQEGAKLFVGKRLSYHAFCNASCNPPYSDYKRCVSKLDITASDEGSITFQVEADRFLYRMVRNIVGTLAYVGRGKITLEELATLFEEGKRADGGITAPAHGLMLNKLYY